MKEQTLQPSESFLVAALLAISGGFLDAYTYVCRGGVFANAQTGNLVLLAVRLSEQRLGEALRYLAPVAAFSLGVVLAELIRERLPSSQWFHWRHLVLLLEVAVLAAAAALPLGEGDQPVNVMVSFVCAMQVEAFRKVRGQPFASTMCTGNLRSGTDLLYRGVRTGDRKLVGKALRYFGVIGCFMAGAALGGVLSAWWGQWAVLTAVCFQAAAFFRMSRR